MQYRLTLPALLVCATTVLPLPVAAEGIAGPYLASRQAAFASDYEQGARYFVQAVRRDPTNLALLERALITMLGKGDMGEATRMAVMHEDAGGESRFVSLALTALAAERGDFAEIPAPQAESSGIDPLLDGLVHAWALLGQGDMTSAAAAFDKVAEISDFANLARYHQALAFAAVGDFESANGILSGETYGPLNLTPRGIKAHSQVLMQLDMADAARDLLQQALAAGMNSDLDDVLRRVEAGPVDYDFITEPSQGVAEVFFNMALILNGRADAETVLLYARLAEHLRPDHADAILISAESLESLGQYDLAVQSFGNVSQDDPAYLLAELGRANALYRAERKDAAIEVLGALTKSEPENVMVWAAYGDMLGRERRDEEAIEAYTRALQLRDEGAVGNWPIYYRRGIIHERNDRLGAMEADFRKALELSPDQPDVLNYLGYSLVEQRVKLDEALEMIETAVEKRPQSGYITDSLGWVFYRLGRFEEAVAPMERAVELLPVDPIINDHLGDVYWMVGREREAEFQWKRALSFEPEEEEAERIRRKLEVGLHQVLEEEAASGETQTAQD